MDYRKYTRKKSFVNDSIFIAHIILITAIQLFSLKFQAVCGEHIFWGLEIVFVMRLVWQYKLILDDTDLLENGTIFFVDYSEVLCETKRIFFHGKYSYSLIVKTKDGKIKTELSLLIEDTMNVILHELKTNPIPLIKTNEKQGRFMLNEILSRYDEVNGNPMDEAAEKLLDETNKETFYMCFLFRYIMLFIIVIT